MTSSNNNWRKEVVLIWGSVLVRIAVKNYLDLAKLKGLKYYDLCKCSYFFHSDYNIFTNSLLPLKRE